MRKIIAGIALMGSIVLAACGPLASAPATPETWTPPPTVTPVPTAIPTPTRPALTTYTVQRGTVERSVELQGRVAAVGERELSFAVDGVVKAVYVTPDTEIARGQVLAELEAGELEDRLAQAKQQYTLAQQQLDRALGEMRFPLRRAEIDLEVARTALAQLLAPPDATKIAAARAALQQAEAARDRARNDASAVKTRAELALQQAQKRLIAAQAEFSAALYAAEQDKTNNSAQERLARAGDALRAAEEEVARLQIEYDTARNNEIAAVQAAEAQVMLAQTALDELLKGPDPLKVAEARRAVAVAELAVEQARSNIRVDPQLERAVEEAKQGVDDIRRQIEALKLVAGLDGRILAVNVAPGSVVRGRRTSLHRAGSVGRLRCTGSAGHEQFGAAGCRATGVDLLRALSGCDIPGYGHRHSRQQLERRCGPERLPYRLRASRPATRDGRCGNGDGRSGAARRGALVAAESHSRRLAQLRTGAAR
jgi:HlyD family secretion protein